MRYDTETWDEILWGLTGKLKECSVYRRLSSEGVCWYVFGTQSFERQGACALRLVSIVC